MITVVRNIVRFRRCSSTTALSRFITNTQPRNPNNNPNMSDDANGPFTTNAQDQENVAKLKTRLAETSSSTPQTSTCSSTKNNNKDSSISSVSIDNGRHKYVLISAESPSDGQQRYFVVSKNGATYHVNAAEPFVEQLETLGFGNIRVTGGGRIDCNPETKTMSIFGYSYGFGLANHAISQSVVAADERYKHYDITISNEGY